MDRLNLLSNELPRSSSMTNGNGSVKRRMFIMRRLALGCVLLAALNLLYVLAYHVTQTTQHGEAQVPGWAVNTSRNLSYYIHNTTILSPSEVCASPPYLFVVICSAVENFKARMAIRNTWANASNLNALYDNDIVRVAFLLGQSDNNTINDLIVDESFQYNDIIQEKFYDTYNNLTLKSAMMLKWVNTNCQQAKYLMKTDDDVFVNIPTLLRTLRSRPQIADTLIGDLFINTRPISDPQDKWYMPSYMFAERIYPNYLSGMGYVMSLDVASKLYDAALVNPLVHLEDVYITGICARYAKLRPMKDPGISHVPREAGYWLGNTTGILKYVDKRSNLAVVDPDDFHDVSKEADQHSCYRWKPPLTKKSYQGKSKSTKPNVIHESSLHEYVMLRETEYAWRPACLKPPTSAEEDRALEELYKKVRNILNELTPQKFEILVSQLKALEIDTQEKSQGVVDLVFEKAVNEPNFSVACALMCKELSQIKVMADEKKNENDDENSKVQGPAPVRAEVNFRKLIIERCQMQFSKQTDDVVARAAKVKEIEESTDPEKKKELQADLKEHDRRVRVRSLGNIRFIGELFKKDMLSIKIMFFCINHLLSTPDEESLECLCTLLTTIGKVLDSRVNQKVPDGLGPCFVQLAELAGKKNQRKISSRIRFMIQDVIDLRANQWVPRRDENKPKMMNQIQKEAESERSDTQSNNRPMNTPRKDDRNNDRRRHRGGGSGMEEGGWSQPVGKTRQQPHSVETSKLSTKAPAPDGMRLGSRSSYARGAQSAVKPMLQANKHALLEESGTGLHQGKSQQRVIKKKKKEYALLDSMSSDLDKRPPLQVSGSRSTGPRDYGRSNY